MSLLPHVHHDVGLYFDFDRLKLEITNFHVSLLGKKSNNVDIKLSNEGVTLNISCRGVIHVRKKRLKCFFWHPQMTDSDQKIHL